MFLSLLILSSLMSCIMDIFLIGMVKDWDF